MTEHQNKMLESALSYYHKGFSVIPLRPQNKLPLINWKTRQYERANPQQIRGWVESYPDLNIGLVTGSISGVAVVDIEKGGSAEGYPPTATVRTGRLGWHLFYSIPKGEKISTAIRVRELTDIIGEGSYVVAPPSSTDNLYEWVMPLTQVSDLPPFPVEMFAKASTEDWRDIPAAGISEGSRNDSMARVLGGMLSRLDKSEYESLGWPIALGVNQTMKPPLSEKEVRQVFESIASKAAKDAPVSSDEIPDYQTYTLAELYEGDYPVKWLVKDLIPLGSITAITGDSNSYKSFLTQNLAMDVITGKPFLDHFAVETKGKVLIVDEENLKSTTQKRFKDLGMPAGPDLLFLSFANFRADQKNCIAGLKRVIAREKPVMVVLDSLVDIHSADENSSVQMAEIFNELRAEILTSDSALIVIHHRRKGQVGQGSNTGQSIRGASAIRAAIDTHLAIDRKGMSNEIRITQDKLRIQQQLKPFVAALGLNEGMNISFSYKGEDTTRDEELEDVKEDIITTLEDAALEEPIPACTKQVLAEVNRTTEGKISEAIKELLKSGLVVRGENAAKGLHQFYLASAYTGPLHKSSEKIREELAAAEELATEPEAPAAIAADN